MEEDCTPDHAAAPVPTCTGAAKAPTPVPLPERTFTEAELLATHSVAEPLFALGVRCHGGFDADGIYRSPRTLNRMRAIGTWQANHEATFGTPILDVALETFPGTYPNAAQARYLLSEGIRQPMITTLTRIGTVEGFGAFLRYVSLPHMQRYFVEDIAGTALDHLERGLIEAHARDEAGWGDEAGHSAMWFAIRDIAFENPMSEDETTACLARIGLPAAGGVPGAEALRREAAAACSVAGIEPALETLIRRLIGVLLIEIRAYLVFTWAEDLLGDAALVAGEGEAARLVGCIRQDETPHVAYLRTVLSEMRARTFRTDSGKGLAGADVIDPLLDRSLADSLGEMERRNVAGTLAELAFALDGHRRANDILAAFHSLGDRDIPPDLLAGATAGAGDDAPRGY